MPAAPPVSDRVFASGEFTAVVRGADPGTAAWLAEYLAPTFSDEPAARDDLADISIRVDAERFSQCLEQTVPTGAVAHCFTLDQANARLPLHRRDDARSYAIDEHYRFALRTCSDGATPRVEILAELDRPGGRLALMRTLRELAGAHAKRCGEIPIHGSAVEIGDGVIAFIGEKRAGKSTLLVHALLGGSARYVGNDRLWLCVRDGRVSVRGVPTIVTLRDGTLDLSPRLRDELHSCAWHWSSSLEEALTNRRDDHIALSFDLEGPPRVSPTQLCSLLDVDSAPGGPLSRIVFPRIDASRTRRFRIERLSPAVAMTRLVERGLFEQGHSADFLCGGVAEPQRPSTRTLRAIAEAVACFDCVLGPEAYRSPTVWDALRTLD